MEINLQKVAFSYSNNKKDIKKGIYNIEIPSLSFDKPEIVCVCGHTGSGKSTLVQLLNCLYKPTSGTISIDKEIVSKKTKLNPIRKKVGLVFQFPEYQVFEDTVLGDVEFGPKNFGLDNPEECALKALEMMNIKDLKDYSPFILSGGQIRKVAIAGILASDPKTIVLDEPTAGLDSKSRTELINLLKELKEQGKTVIVITHDMDLVNEISDRLLVMQKGHLVYDGVSEELFSDLEKTKEYNLNEPTLYKLLRSLNKELNANYPINAKNVSDAISILGGKYE